MRKASEMVSKPGENDIVFGRGQRIQRLPGNIRFRKLVGEIREAHEEAPRRCKSLLSREVRLSIETLVPPGRFLEATHGKPKCYRIIRDPRRIALKISQSVRDLTKKVNKTGNNIADPAASDCAVSEVHREQATSRLRSRAADILATTINPSSHDEDSPSGPSFCDNLVDKLHITGAPPVVPLALSDLFQGHVQELHQQVDDFAYKLQTSFFEAVQESSAMEHEFITIDDSDDDEDDKPLFTVRDILEDGTVANNCNKISLDNTTEQPPEGLPFHMKHAYASMPLHIKVFLKSLYPSTKIDSIDASFVFDDKGDWGDAGVEVDSF